MIVQDKGHVVYMGIGQNLISSTSKLGSRIN